MLCTIFSLALGKRMFQKWIDCGLLTRENLAEIDLRVSLFQAPSEVGRLPGHISSQYGGFYGGQLVQPDACPHTFGPDSVRLHPRAVGRHPNTVGHSPECCRVHLNAIKCTRMLSGAPNYRRARRPRRTHAYAHAHQVTIPSTP